MKKYFYIFFLFLFITSSIGISLLTVDSIIFAKAEIKKVFNEKRIKEFNLILNDTKNLLFSLSYHFAHSQIVKMAYEKNNPQLILNEYKSLFEIMKKKELLNELHFFKYPAKNFLDFPNFTQPIDYSLKRLDILKVETMQKPDIYFYTSGKYPGFRSVYPIKINKKIVGIVSVGEDIRVFYKKFKKLGAKKVSILINRNILKYSLFPNIYKQYQSIHPLIKKYFLLGDKIDNKYYIVTEIPIVDIFGNNLGKIIIGDDYKDIFNNILKHVFFYIIMFIFIIIAVLFFNISLLNYIIKELKKTNKYIEYIKNQEFYKLPNQIEVKNEINAHQQAIIEAGKEIGILIDILQSKKNEYYQKAYIDALTGAFNRRFLEEKEHELFLKYKTLKKDVVILMFDIDNFKKINDTYGHDVGDIVLSEVGEIVKKIIRKDDIFIRYGGEEFLVILEDEKLKDAIKVAEKIRKTIANQKIIINNQKEIKVTVSIGISELKPTDKSLWDAIKRADEKLYKAKKNGKNRCEV